MRRPWLRQKSGADRVDRAKSRFVAHHFKAIAQAYRGFRSAEDEIAVARWRSGQAAKHITLRILVEIDQDVPAQDHVEGSKRRKIRKKIEVVIFNHGANLRSDLPLLAELREIFDEQLNRQPALHFELAVQPLPRATQHGA